MSYILTFFFIAFGHAFEHEQALHAKNFRGESQTFQTALWLSVYASWAVRVAILFFIGLKLSWLAAIAIFFGGMLTAGTIAGLLSAIAARFAGSIGQLYISLAAFVVWPACFLAAYFSLPIVG